MNDNVFAYCSAMAQARRMLSLRLITKEEYGKIDTMMLHKYGLSFKQGYFLLGTAGYLFFHHRYIIPRKPCNAKLSSHFSHKEFRRCKPAQPP